MTTRKKSEHRGLFTAMLTVKIIMSLIGVIFLIIMLSTHFNVVLAGLAGKPAW